jgi:hypothetical protein
MLQTECAFFKTDISTPFLLQRLGEAKYTTSVRGAWAHWYGTLAEYLMKQLGISCNKGYIEEILDVEDPK